MNRLGRAERAQVVRCLVEGASVRETVRLTGAAKKTVLRLLVEIGDLCAAFHDRTVRGVKAKRIEADEVWSFVYAKSKNVPEEKRGKFGFGDVWTWTALEAESKLIVSWLVGSRDGACAEEFMRDVASRVANRLQLTADGHKVYLEADEAAFGGAIDYSMLVKHYGAERAGEARYSPAVCTGCSKASIVGNPAPDPELVSTSYVVRSNLTLRMGARRFTRLTNAHSKKLENYEAAVALHTVVYNFCREQVSLRCTPAMAAGLTDRIWSVEDLVALLEESESK